MKKYLPIMIAVLLLASCRTHKKAVEQIDATPVVTSDGTVTQSGKSKGKDASKAINQLTGVSAKLNFTALQQGVKKASVGGSVRMKRDEIIQIRLVAIIVEVGRLELTPEYLLVQDRINKQYVRIDWDEVPELTQAGVNFETFQQLFWGEFPNAEKGVSLRLNQSTSLNLTYADWTKLFGQRFPGQMTLTIQTGQKNYGGIFKYNNLQAEENMKVEPTTITSSYKKVDLEAILKQLIK